ncbi:MAG: class I SAM-dependent methyltransferase [Firmicutes bacterium]|nr:class I SAM-dependent methyltransferase [Erysipelotrichaceae bacterium]MDD7228257.1 class I SAM-dependent methyltransferase [Bacillota bacterium]MDY4972282.1 class I SAM-dependent methyltransferase [Erysipelotrichaceae bacterium]MDY5997681.1 class I SAM-dependent methyltransferase [Erysipelotrichaceae bacterium]
MRTLATNWIDYECLDAGNGQKVERWKDIILKRPDPQAVWTFDDKQYKYDAIYHRSNKGGGSWQFNKKLPEFWTINYKDLTFKVSPTNFKHTGIFPEQAVNWDFMMDKIQNCDHEVKVLNLFAYTGCATMACSKAGASEVVHVDASKGMIEWAKQNMQLSHLENNKIRFIVDDVLKFVQREKRRGHKYHGIVMDPPSYGRGPNNELWKLEDQLYELINSCLDILDDDPLFFIINCYTTGFSNIVLENILKQTILKKYNFGKIETGEIGLPIKKDHMILPCGIYGRFYQ